MALSIKANQITGPTATGDYSSTNPGFQPKGMLLFGGLNSTTGTNSDANICIGWADSSNAEGAVGFNSDETAASSDAVRMISTTAIYSNFTAGTVTQRMLATNSSWDATGFTLNFSTLTTANSVLMNYLAFGGSDITNTKVGSFPSNTGTGNQSVTGVGFQPDIVFMWATLSTSAAAANNNSNFTFGVMAPSGQWACGTKNQNSAATMNTSRMFYNTRCYAMPSTTTNAVFQDMSYVSMNADGFTFNIDTAGGSAVLIGYYAIKGGQWKVGSETQPTSATTKATTGVGFQPSALILASVNDSQTAGTADHTMLSIGVTSGTSNNAGYWVGDRDNVADSIVDNYMAADKCIVMATNAAGTAVVTAESALSAFDSDGFTLNWTTADATARVFGYVAIGANAVSVGTKQFALLGVG